MGVRRHGDKHAAGDDCLFLIDGRRIQRRRAVRCGECRTRKNTGLHPAAQGFDKLTIGGKLRRKDQLAVLVSGEIAVVGDDTEIREKPAHFVNANQIGGNLILLVIAVGVALLKGEQHIRQLINGRRHGQPQRFKPLRIEPDADLTLGCVEQREGSDAPVFKRNDLFPIRMSGQKSGEIGHVFLDQRSKVNQCAAIQKGLLLLAGQAGFKKHVGRNIALSHAGKKLGVCLFIRNAGSIHMNAGQGFHAREEKTVSPAAPDGFRFKSGERCCACCACRQAEGSRKDKSCYFFHRRLTSVGESF